MTGRTIASEIPSFVGPPQLSLHLDHDGHDDVDDDDCHCEVD